MQDDKLRRTTPVLLQERRPVEGCAVADFEGAHNAVPVGFVHQRGARLLNHCRVEFNADGVASKATSFDQRGAGTGKRVDHQVAATGVASHQLIGNLRHKVAPEASVVRAACVASVEQP